MTGTATVTQQIWLTKIELIAPEEMEEGEILTAGTVFTPLNFTEPVQYSSSDSSVIIFIDGDIDARSGGTATVAVTGGNSGVSASRTIKVTEGEFVEEFLRIENNLSEIAEAGEKAQAEARDHIGLGELATKDSLSAEDVGAAPMASESLSADQDLDDLTAPGDYFQSVCSYATEQNHYPEETAGAVRVVATGVSEGACVQFYWPHNSTKGYRRCGYAKP